MSRDEDAPDRETPREPPVIVDPTGRPARIPPDARCPQCGAGPDKRVPSCGFGAPYDICAACAFEFKE